MFGLGLIELAFAVIFFILMVVGTAFDRRYYEGPKWYIFGIGIAIVAVYYWMNVDFTTIWTAVSSLSFWIPLGYYLVAGLAYSVLEFILSVRKMARLHAASFKAFMKRTQTFWKMADGEIVDPQFVQLADGKHWVGNVRDREGRKEVTRHDFVNADVMKSAQDVDATAEQKKAATMLLDTYLRTDEYRVSDLKKDFIQVELNQATYEVQPVINRSRLSGFIGAWTFFWPAYAFSLIIGDFLVEIFRMLGDLFSKMGGRFVRFTFADVFKLS